MTRDRSDRGAAAVELALLLPLLVFVALAGVTTVRLVNDHGELAQLSAAASRYATRASLEPGRTEYRFRPTAAEVEAYVRSTARIPVDAVTVSPDPSTAFPGDEIVVTIRTHTDAGPLAAVANGVAGLAGAAPVFPEGVIEHSSSTAMRQE